MLIVLSHASKVMRNESTKLNQRKTTLKWNIDGELSSIDMARIIDALSIKELKECELACNTLKKDNHISNLGLWW